MWLEKRSCSLSDTTRLPMRRLCGMVASPHPGGRRGGRPLYADDVETDDTEAGVISTE